MDSKTKVEESLARSETIDPALWRDKARWLRPLGMMIPVLILTIIPMYAWHGHSLALWSGSIVIFLLIPLIDAFSGKDLNNPPLELVEKLEKDPFYKWIVFLWLPFEYLAFFAVLYSVTLGNPIDALWNIFGTTPDVLAREFDLTVWDKIGLSLSLAMVTGISINTAHELGHKRENVERWLAKIALAPTFYGHFATEHNLGHHTRVSTPEDPASSRLGESFYAFWPRTVVGSLKSAWRIEKRRFNRKKTHPFHLSNNVLNAWLMSVVLWSAVLILFGIEALPYLLIQGVVGFSLLEVVNYLEHHGLKRAKVGAKGKERYERVMPMHSWDNYSLLSNLFLLRLSLHANHHANPTRRYQTLRVDKDSPKLPLGYAGMIPLALVPPVWRRVMEPRLVEHLNGDVRLANIQPGKEAKYLAKFPPPAAEGELHMTDQWAQKYVGEPLVLKCPECGWVYSVVEGNEHQGLAAGQAWSEIPEDFVCPDCGVRERNDFIAIEYA